MTDTAREKIHSLNIKIVLRALKYRNYRLFFGGQIISLIGSWMQLIALSWLVYRLTDSEFILGLVSFATQIPAFFLSPFAGVFADQKDKRKILIATQTLFMLQAFLLVGLLAADVITVWMIILLNVMMGLINGFDMTSRQAFVVEMIEDKEDLGNAIALNSMMFNAARLIGPSLAGLIVAYFGETICFLINGVSYSAVIIALIKMKIDKKDASKNSKNVLQNLREGLKYTLGFPPIRSLIILLGIMSLVAMPYIVLMPVFAKDILGGGPDTLGFLMGAVGIGALCGAVFLASRRSVIGLETIIFRTTSLFGIMIILFSLSTTLELSLLLMVFAGFSMMVQFASSNTIIQTITEDEMRGRVLSFYTMSFLGMAPLGSLIAGAIASKIGAPQTLIGGGIICLISSLIFASRLNYLRKFISPIYVKMGIIKEVATGLQSSSHLRYPQND